MPHSESQLVGIIQVEPLSQLNDNSPHGSPDSGGDLVQLGLQATASRDVGSASDSRLGLPSRLAVRPQPEYDPTLHQTQIVMANLPRLNNELVVELHQLQARIRRKVRRS